MKIIITHTIDPRDVHAFMGGLQYSDGMVVEIDYEGGDQDRIMLDTTVPVEEPWYVEAKRLDDVMKKEHAKQAFKAAAEAEWVSTYKEYSDAERDPRTPAGREVVNANACPHCSQFKGYPCITVSGKSAQFTHGSRIALMYGVSAV